jgi:hypothetical protein
MIPQQKAPNNKFQPDRLTPHERRRGSAPRVRGAICLEMVFVYISFEANPASGSHKSLGGLSSPSGATVLVPLRIGIQGQFAIEDHK